jgi:O-antigen/teichoic acid export membrane protein
MFASRVVVAAIGIVNSLLLSRLIGPGGKGDFFLISMLPAMVMVVIQLGLPQSLSFHAARGEAKGLLRKTLVLTAVLSAPAFALTVLALPALQATFLRGLDPVLVILAMSVLPLALHGTYTTGIALGLGAIRSVAAINIGHNIVVMAGYAGLVGLAGFGVPGAIITTIAAWAVLATGRFVTVQRLMSAMRRTVAPSYRQLLGFGMSSWPGSLTTFFSQRIDVFLLALFLPDASAPLGFYSLAVALLEIVFFLPDAVATLFFPHVAGLSRASADEQVPIVSRLTLIVTLAAAVAMIPPAAFVVTVVLPDFGPAWPAFLILLPGVVSLSFGRVLSGYLSGLGRTGLQSAIHVGGFVLNVAINVALIPTFGIVGAALASLVSYTATAVAFAVAVAGTSGTSLRSLWLPRSSDLRLLGSTSLTLMRGLGILRDRDA